MSPFIVILTIALYFALLFLVSWLAGRRADNAGFFTGNRRSPWYVVAFAMIGASISGVTYVSVPGMVTASSFGYLQMVMGFIVGQLIIAFVLTPLFYRMNLTSIYQYLENRFGVSSYRTGAWFFFLSKMLGAAVRLYLVCLTLQLLVFGPLGVPFIGNVVITMLLIWLYTFRGGVKSLVWTDSLKTLCLVVSVVLCIYYIGKALGLTAGGMVQTVADSDLSRIFFLDDVTEKQYFPQFARVATQSDDKHCATVRGHCPVSLAGRTALSLCGQSRHYHTAQRRTVPPRGHRRLSTRSGGRNVRCRTDLIGLFRCRFCPDGTHHVIHR